ncbi:Sto1p [Sporobolomyces koalae]|uniref:Sto1p n=1 Tax=Sporobolomyces koalae TaxID=500713 RepID=UPI00316CFEE2
MSDYRNGYGGGGGQQGGYGQPNRFYPTNGYNGHSGPMMGPAGYQRKRQRGSSYRLFHSHPKLCETDSRLPARSTDEDYPESPGGGNYRRRTDERGNYGSPSQRQSRGQYDNRAQNAISGINKFKDAVWKVGNHSDYDPVEDLPRLAQEVESWYFKDKSVVFLAFRAAVSELPHKLHHYASLLAYLSLKAVAPPTSLASRLSGPSSYPAAPGLPTRPVESGEGDAATTGEENENQSEGAEEVVKINVGKEIVEDLMKAFQAFLDERKWKSVRYCVTLFTQLTSLPVSSPLVASTSLLTLLSSFLSVLDEPGLRLSRGDECVRIIVEALLRLEGGDEGAFAAAGGLDSLREGIQAYADARKVGKDAFADEETKGQWVDTLEYLVSSLFDTQDGHHVSAILSPPSLPSISSPSPAHDEEPASPLYLPMILVPPELEETDLTLVSHGGSSGAGAEKAIPAPPTSAGLRGDEGVGYEGTRLSLRLFNDETVPDKDDKAGNVLRGMINDIVNLYEINRKEGAAVLLELPRWVKKGTFKDPKAAAKQAQDEDEELADGPGWSLENLIVETIFNSILCVPAPPHPLAYYHSLLTELCRLSPQTIAPSLGKSVRKLYASLGNDSGAGGKIGQPVLDPSGLKRFADWFAVHLSNFGFMWGWQDWASDMEVSDKHPKRVFVKRVIELEVRLSYYDRIKGTVPEVMLETAIMPDDAPGPEYDYDSSDNTHAAAASSFLRLIRSKASVQEAEEELNAFQKSLESEHSMSEEEADKIKRDMAVQTVLNVGSRSFSHFLNALERYLVLLRNLTPTAAKKQDLLRAVSTFWRRNGQFHLIVLDKLLQYRLLEPSDVITWVFAPQTPGEKRKTWANLDLWQTVSIVLRTLESRTEAGRGRVEGLKREEETREAEKTDQGESADNADGDATIRDATSQNPEIASAISYLSELENDQNQVLVQIVEHFVKLLPEDVDKDDWEVWWIEGWFREFCRVGLPPKVNSRAALAQKLGEVEIPARSAVRLILNANKQWSEYA